jgi:hypothetical protein
MEEGRVYLRCSVSTGNEKKAVAEINAKLESVLDRSVKKHQGNIEFCFEASETERVLALLASLTLIEYIFVSLVTFSLSTRSESSLVEIRDKVTSVGHQRLSTAINMWQVFSGCGKAPPTAGEEMLTFRTIGKRGGKHDFTSDDIKRAVANGLMQHATISLHGTASKKEYDFQVCGHVHHSQVWIGFGINPKPLSDIASATGNVWVNPLAQSIEGIHDIPAL